MNTDPAALDVQELMHLALGAIKADNDEGATVLLKRAIALSPEDGRLHYLLGAVHAQIGLFDRAIAEIGHAVELTPQLHAAHFQLGMLHLRSAAVAPAMQAWSPLDRLDEAHPLRHFKNGMVHLLEARYAQCIDELRRGIDLNEEGALSVDMRAVIEQAEEALAAHQHDDAKAIPPSTSPAGERPLAQSPQHVLLSFYQMQNGKQDDK